MDSFTRMVKNESVGLADLKKVPAFPAVAARLLNLLAGQEASAAEVATLISSDAALTARLLQYVNSPMYGLRSTVTDMRQAVGLLGLDRTREITIMIATAGYAAQARQNAELQNCWRHPLATAVIADEIAKSCGAFTQTVFTAGVLHDIGRLGLMIVYPREYTRAIQGAAGHYLDLLDFEREQFGIDHAEAGRLLVEAWKLPEEFRIIAGRHHDPCEGSELDPLQIIHVACQLADVLGFGVLPPQVAGDIRAILDTLPGGAGKRLPGTEEELRTRVEHHISKVI